jgi:MYXO-CTERM domain-containing protein
VNWFRGVLIGLAGVSLVSACSSGERRPEEEAPEVTGQVSQAITAACNLDTIGLPCDPDGPGGTKLECEGVCGIATSGLVSCQAVATGTLDGVVCGTTNGVGDNACKRHCSGKTCLAANAPEGAACRPTNKSNPCEGSCDGAGQCDNLGGSACTFGRQEQLCKFDSCNFADVSECLTKNLARNTLCSDADACSISRCNGVGACSSGGTLGCDDGNACTDDSCDPEDGGCLGVNDDSNECSDGNACLTGEYCSNGGCVAGTVDVDCNDGNPCTVDSCDPNTGCANVPKACGDGNACTQDVCDPATGVCSNPDAPACNDGNDCTIDTCDTASGCVFTAMDCDDDDECTTDGCSAGSCTHDVVGCSDGDACTDDSCEAASGCVYAPIAGCGGEAGAPNGTGGESGSAGETGAGGEPGAGGEAGGPDGMGGAPEGSSQAGSAQGGSSESGSSQGASSQGGSSPGTSGSGASAGSDVAGSTANESSSSSGCGCRTAGGSSPSNSAPVLALLLGAGLAVARRRRAGERAR